MSVNGMKQDNILVCLFFCFFSSPSPPSPSQSVLLFVCLFFLQLIGYGLLFGGELCGGPIIITITTNTDTTANTTTNTTRKLGVFNGNNGIWFWFICWWCT